MRETTICLSYDEKDALDAVKREMYGTDEVPYGTVIDGLTKRYLNE